MSSFSLQVAILMPTQDGEEDDVNSYWSWTSTVSL